MAPVDQPHEQFVFPEEVLPRGNALWPHSIFYTWLSSHSHLSLFSLKTTMTMMTKMEESYNLYIHKDKLKK